MTHIAELPLVQILENLKNLDSTFANILIDNSFKGFHNQLLKDFVLLKITEEKVIDKWNAVVLSGEILKDIKLPSLDVITRLQLVTLILNKLEIDTKDLELLFEIEIPPQTLLYALSLDNSADANPLIFNLAWLKTDFLPFWKVI